MNIKLFFLYCEEYFNLINSPGLDFNYKYDFDEESKFNEESKFDLGDEEKGFENWIEETKYEFCFYNLLLFIIQLLSNSQNKLRIKNK